MIIQLLDGTRFDIANYDLKRLFHHIPSATIDHNSVAVDGRSDVIVKSKFNNRVINVEFLYESNDIFDYYLLRDEINNLFMREEAYYIIFKNEPYKRWLVKVASQFTVPPNPRMQSFEIEFLTINTYAESVATTATAREWDVDAWGWNNSIDWDGFRAYDFNTNNFVVNNLGNVTIDPRQHKLTMTMRGTFNTYLGIENATTGDLYVYNSPLSSLDTLVIDGINTRRNGVSNFGLTNRKLITLAPGNNQINITGGTLDAISFDFRFLYN